MSQMVEIRMKIRVTYERVTTVEKSWRKYEERKENAIISSARTYQYFVHSRAPRSIPDLPCCSSSALRYCSPRSK